MIAAILATRTGRAAAIILAAGVGLGVAYFVGRSGGYAEGRDAERAAAIKEAAKRITNMENNNAHYNKLPYRERCIALMRDSGLPAYECDDGQRVPVDPVF